MATTRIHVASEFSRFPAGRFRDDSEFSGERFRDQHLIPALESFDLVIVDMDGVLGFGSSFLEEAFGGLVRKGVCKAADLQVCLRFEGGVASDRALAWQFIRDAKPPKI